MSYIKAERFPEKPEYVLVTCSLDELPTDENLQPDGSFHACIWISPEDWQILQQADGTEIP